MFDLIQIGIYICRSEE
uniref:Uncharacterized protein n=1 Tax=Anguilla anguilla TaxID=7936 RepID=A0A0E9SAH9_ANGAN